MAATKSSSFVVLLILLSWNSDAVVSSDGLNLPVSDDKQEQTSSPTLSAAAVGNPPAFKPWSGFLLSLLSSFPEDLEINDYCRELLHIFGQRYIAYVNCLVPAARPVKVCQNCFSTYVSLNETYRNISSDNVGTKHKVTLLCVAVDVPRCSLNSTGPRV